MAVERCDECGFDSRDWTDGAALVTIEELPARWAETIAGLDDADLGRCPVAGMWSIAEYTNHVRETMRAMRSLLDTALAYPGSDLDAAPEPRVNPEPRAVDAGQALAGFEHEARRLRDQLDSIPRDRWAAAWVTVDGTRLDVGWIARHTVHDVTHHLLDVERLRLALS